MGSRMAWLERKIMPEPMSGCHLWVGHKTKHGYGRIWVDWKNVTVHRWLYEQAHGPLGPPPADCVLHRCGNASCVNLAHLYVGTQRDNAKDSFRHGTLWFMPGERHPYARLSDEQVHQIKARRHDGLSYRQLAAEFGIGDAYAWQIVAGKKRRGSLRDFAPRPWPRREIGS